MHHRYRLRGKPTLATVDLKPGLLFWKIGDFRNHPRPPAPYVEDPDKGEDTNPGAPSH